MNQVNNEIDNLIATAIQLHKNGSLQQATKICYEIISSSPENIQALHILGIINYQSQKYNEAIEYLLKVMQINPDIINVNKILGNAYLKKEKVSFAIKYFQHLVKLDPKNADNYTALGIAQVNNHEIEAGVTSLQHAKKIRFNKCIIPQHARYMPLFRAKHDAEQIEYLKQQNIISNEYDEYLATLNKIYHNNINIGKNPSDVISLTQEQTKILLPSFNEIIYEPNISLPTTNTLNPSLDFKAYENKYYEQFPEIVVIHDFLSPEALAGLRKYCLEATIWKTAYESGYLGAMQEQTFSFELLYNIVNALKTKLPKIFKDYLLYQAWAFKYDSSMQGTSIHADFAKVNVNFWITPNEANINHDTGGLIIWDKASPTNWNFQDFNHNDDKIYNFLTEQKANPIKIPYKENTIIIFNSSLFHKTDAFHFKDSYEHRRINITLLYGQALKVN